MVVSLEKQLEDMYAELRISKKQQKSLNSYLELVKGRDVETWEHSVRVGLKGVEVANYIHIVHPNALFYSGLLHDVGKILTNPNSLKKKEGEVFDEDDMEELKKHPVHGYKLLRGIHDFSARIVLRHHKFVGGYPQDIPDSDIEFSTESEVNVAYYARILSLIDFHDAATYRKNDGYRNKRLLSKREVKKYLLKTNPDQEYFIKQLYKAKIF